MRKAKVMNERLLVSYDSDWLDLPLQLTNRSISLFITQTQGYIVWKLKMGDFFLENE